MTESTVKLGRRTPAIFLHIIRARRSVA